jgi:hypothetical protein
MPKQFTPSQLLGTVSGEMRESDPLKKRLETIADRMFLVEAHNAELIEDARKMAKQITNIRADLSVSELRNPSKTAG